MNKTVNTILFLLFIHWVNGQSPTIKEIVERSRGFYSKYKAGHFSVEFNFKSSIAESYSISRVNFSYCNTGKEYLIEDSLTTAVITEKKYFFVDHGKRKYVDLSSWEEAKEDKISNLNRFPQINDHFFDQLLQDDFRVERNGDRIIVGNYFLQVRFDSADYSIKSFTRKDLSKYGLQVMEWNITSEEYFIVCNKAFESLIPGNYELVKDLAEVKENPNLVGKSIYELIPDSMVMDNKEILKSDGLTGRYVLVDFFYQSCMPCIASFPKIKELNNLKEGLIVIGVDPYLEDSSTLSRFKSRYKLNYPLLSGKKAAYFNSIFNPTGMFPYYVLAGKDGKILETFEGFSEDFFDRVKARINNSDK